MKKLIYIAILAILFAIPFLLPTNKTNQQNQYKMKLDTYFCAEFKSANSDKWIDLGCKHNVITNAGLDDIENVLAGKYKYIALGNGTAPTQSSTSLDNEQTDCGLARQEGTYYDLGVGNWEINTTFTYTCDTTRIVNTTAAFNATSGGIMFAGGLLNAEAQFSTNGDQLKVRHIYQISEV